MRAKRTPTTLARAELLALQNDPKTEAPGRAQFQYQFYSVRFPTYALWINGSPPYG